MRHQVAGGGDGVAVQDGINGIVAGDILYLAAAEVVPLCKQGGVRIAEVGQQLMPDGGAGFHCGFVKAYLIEETPLEGIVHILSQIGGGNQYSVEGLQLL